jgi:hypothetical protein
MAYHIYVKLECNLRHKVMIDISQDFLIGKRYCRRSEDYLFYNEDYFVLSVEIVMDCMPTGETGRRRIRNKE